VPTRKKSPSPAKEARQLAKWASKSMHQLTKPEPPAGLSCHDCGRPVRPSRHMTGAPRCPACRQDRAGSAQAIEMSYHPAPQVPADERKPAEPVYMSAAETLAWWLEYSHQLTLEPAKLKSGLSFLRMNKVTSGVGRPVTGARFPVNNKGYWNGEEPTRRGRPRTRPDEPKGPSLRQRTRAWAKRERPVTVCPADWEILRLTEVDEMSAPAIAAKLGHSLKPVAIRQKIARARKALGLDELARS
jgi:ribosomal protein L37AE/L43A